MRRALELVTKKEKPDLATGQMDQFNLILKITKLASRWTQSKFSFLREIFWIKTDTIWKSSWAMIV